MPELRYYRATQEREVKITASSPLEAAQIADAAFKGLIGEGDPIVINVTSPVRELELYVRED